MIFDVETESEKFDLDYHTTFWNSFQRAEEEFVGVRISHPTDSVTLSVVFHFEPNASQFTFQRSPVGDNNNRTTKQNPDYEIQGETVT